MMIGAYTLAGASIHDIEAESGAVYRLLLYVPQRETPAAGWPLLLMTDGNSCFGTAVDALRAQADFPRSTNVGWGVIAALGYPTDEAYDGVRRSWDLTPPPGASYPPFTPDGPEVRTGGADAFLSFIECRLLPFIASHVPVDPARCALFGHSFGGLFALYTLFNRPALFQRIIAASPSIHWEDFTLLRSEAATDFVISLQPAVHLSAGEHEGENLAPFQEKHDDAAERLARKRVERTVHYAQEMATHLASPEGAGLATTFELFAGQTHMGVPIPAIGRAVQIAFALAPDPVPPR